jgi:hypothetical protein
MPPTSNTTVSRIHGRSNDPRAQHQARQALSSYALPAGCSCHSAAAKELGEAPLGTLACRGDSTVAP